MNKGWVKIHRQIENNALWTLEPFTKGQAWVDLIILANHKPGKISIRGNIIDIKRGQLAHSEVTLSERWSWSRNKTRRFLKWLETEQQIEQEKSNVTTLITITKYNDYQLSDTTDDTTDDTAERQQKDTNKNNKNNKNKINIVIPLRLLAVENFEKEWAEYLKHRKQSKKGAMTERALNLLLEKLNQNPSKAIEALHEIINRNWTGFNWDWLKNNNQSQLNFNQKPKPKYTPYPELGEFQDT